MVCVPVLGHQVASIYAPLQAAQSGPRRIPGPAGQAQGGGGGGAQPGGAAAAPPDTDFLSQPWLTALSCLDLEDFDGGRAGVRKPS